VDCSGFRFSRHAIERMFHRGIPPNAVERVAGDGEVIGAYPDDVPFPSMLVLGFDGGQPVHVVVARDPGSGLCHIVTVYRPDPELWGDDFKTRREP
jgi:hypothetical protein